MKKNKFITAFRISRIVTNFTFNRPNLINRFNLSMGANVSPGEISTINLL